MLRKTLFALGVAAFVGLSLQFGGGGAEATANSFTVNQACGDGGVGVNATVNWLGTSTAAREIWVDVSQFNNGWLPDSYATSGAISPNQSSFKWVSLLPNMTYYVRVNQLMAPGYWDGSLTYIFQTGPTCYGGQTASFSAPAYGANTYASGYNYGWPTSSVSLYTTSTYGGSSSFSQQPIDAWTHAAVAAMYLPSREPIKIDRYPYIGVPFGTPGIGGTTGNAGGLYSGNPNCDPSYPSICIPVGTTGLNCVDVLPYTNFTVLPPDPNGFDADHDGIGCE